MNAHTADWSRGKTAVIEAANTLVDETVAEILARARDLDPEDAESFAGVLAAAKAVGRCEQARHGQLILLLAQVERGTAVPGARGGIAASVSTWLDLHPGQARALAHAAKLLGHLPALAEPLASGTIGAATVNVLARTAKAIKHTGLDPAAALAEVLEVRRRDGVVDAKKHVQVLEHTLDPGSAQETLAGQRARSYARMTQTPSAMTRVEVLLDTPRGALLRAAIEQGTATVIRERQYDGDTNTPDDVRTTEQIQAHVLVRMAEVFLTADPATRGAAFTPATMYYAPLDPTAKNPFAETVHGDLVPRTVLPEPTDPAAHLIELDAHGLPVRLDGQDIDTHPDTRLATPAQRTALALLHKHCTHDGCTRPPTWSLHAHHRIPHGRGGTTTLDNLTLLCAEHHTLTHHHQHTDNHTDNHRPGGR